jgi:hypothetical protein
LDKDKIELILDSDPEATEENSDETGQEEDDVREQAPVLPHQNLAPDQSAGGVCDNTNDTSDNEVIPTNPTCTPRDIEVGTSDGSDKEKHSSIHW